MAIRRFWIGLVVTLLAVSAAWAQDNTKFFPLNDVQPGLKGTGLTIFEGSRVPEFQVEFSPRQARMRYGFMNKSSVLGMH